MTVVTGNTNNDPREQVERAVDHARTNGAKRRTEAALPEVSRVTTQAPVLSRGVSLCAIAQDGSC